MYAGALIIGCGAYAIRDTSPDLSLKKEVVTVEYGQHIILYLIN